MGYRGESIKYKRLAMHWRISQTTCWFGKLPCLFGSHACHPPRSNPQHDENEDIYEEDYRCPTHTGQIKLPDRNGQLDAVKVENVQHGDVFYTTAHVGGRMLCVCFICLFFEEL